MPENNEISYEILFEFLRREKNKEELQEIGLSFFHKAAAMLEEKQVILQANSLSAEEAEKLANQVKNIKRIVEELYHRREKKVMDIAIIKSRTKQSILSKKALLPHEEHLLDQVSIILQHSKGAAVRMSSPHPSLQSPTSLTAAMAQRPAIQQPLAASIAAPMPSPGRQEGHMALHGSSQPLQEPKAFKTSAFPTSDNKILVRFLQPVHKFVGPELEVYGPFGPSDTAVLPSQVADILLEKGMAEKHGTAATAEASQASTAP